MVAGINTSVFNFFLYFLRYVFLRFCQSVCAHMGEETKGEQDNHKRTPC